MAKHYGTDSFGDCRRSDDVMYRCCTPALILHLLRMPAAFYEPRALIRSTDAKPGLETGDVVMLLSKVRSPVTRACGLRPGWRLAYSMVERAFVSATQSPPAPAWSHRP